MNVTVFKQLNEIYTKAADEFVSKANEAIEQKGKFVVALSGGSSPKAIFELLASVGYKQKVDWSKVFVFWVDERWVPLEDDKSNAKMTFETLLNLVAIPKENIFVMYKDGITPEEYASQYEEQIIKVLGDKGEFDFILLGMGEDGHTASLFPGEKVLLETQKWVDAYYLEPQKMYRITLTAPIINKGAYILVITFGTSKKHALSEILHGDYNPNLYPLQIIKPEKGELQLFTDEAALG